MKIQGSAYRLAAIKADASLLAVVVVWGITFVVVKNALTDIGVFSFLAIRFCIAFIFLAIVFWRKLPQINRSTLKAAGIISIFLFAGYAFQTLGLIYTTASNSGFITGMSVIMVPCFYIMLTRKRPGIGAVAGVCLAVSGLALLTLDNYNFSLNYGDLLTFFCAISFALHIICVGIFAPKLDAQLLTLLQIGLTTFICGIVSIAFEPPLLAQNFTPEVWQALLITAIPATALAYLIQNTMQKFTTPVHTAIIFAGEPVFAALAGIYFLGESLSIQQGIGCILILVGTLVNEILPDHGVRHECLAQK